MSNGRSSLAMVSADPAPGCVEPPALSHPATDRYLPTSDRIQFEPVNDELKLEKQTETKIVL
jgi:hypothetical protein